LTIVNFNRRSRRVSGFAAALMLLSIPAAAESKARFPFPSIGDAVVGCHDPANTALDRYYFRQ
jgi:hypothetical protein